VNCERAPRKKLTPAELFSLEKERQKNYFLLKKKTELSLKQFFVCRASFRPMWPVRWRVSFAVVSRLQIFLPDIYYLFFRSLIVFA
jgi:hypothetical protein